MISRLPQSFVPSLIVLCALCVLCAQASLPAADGDSAAVAAADETPPPPVDHEVTLSLGLQHQDISGNERRFDQYVTPPAELFLSQLRWRHMDVAGPALDLRVWDVDEPGGYADLWLNWGDVNVAGQYRRSSFYFDFEPSSGRSHRRDTRLEFYPRSSASRRFTWDISGSEVRWDGTPAAGMIDWRDRTKAASLGYRAGDYWLDVGFQRELFDINTGQFFSGDTSTYRLAFSPARGQRTQVSGDVARQVTELDNFAGGFKATTGQLALQRRVSDELDLLGYVRHFNIDETITQNAYAESQWQGRLELEYRPRRSTRVNAFWIGTATDYVDGRQANIVDTTASTFGFRASARIRPALKVTAGYRHQFNGDLPFSYTSGGALADTLLWSDLERYDLSASFTPRSAVWGWTADYQRRVWLNEAQATANALDSFAVTAWCQMVDGKLMLTGSWLKQDFEAPFIDLVTLRRFASDTEALVLGATLLLSPHDTLYASFAHTDASASSDNLYDRFTIGATHEVSRHNRVLAEINFHDFSDDMVPVLDYDANLYRVEWEHEF